MPDAHRDEEHVRNNVVEAERDEAETWPPNSDEFGDVIAAGHS